MRSTKLFNRFQPDVRSNPDPIKVEIKQTLFREKEDLLSPDDPNDTASVYIKVDGPNVRLGPDDIIGVYPTPGSDNSSDDYLPHITLKRRTLPWERQGPNRGSQREPWMALILLSETELRAAGTGAKPGAWTRKPSVADLEKKHTDAYEAFYRSNLIDKKSVILGPAASVNPNEEIWTTPIDVVDVPNHIWSKIKPELPELDYLCHARRGWDPSAEADRDVAVVIGNRLPRAVRKNSAQPAETHVAFLVSLENRTDLFPPQALALTSGPAVGDRAIALPVGDNVQALPVASTSFPVLHHLPVASTPLLVLHHWSFKPSNSSDFEELAQFMHYRPNGGVLRFGNLPQTSGDGEQGTGGFDAGTDESGYLRLGFQHGGADNGEYRGPLRPMPPPTRSQGLAVRAAPEEFEGADPGDPWDYSHACAFELGRLLTLADGGLLQDLQQITTRLSDEFFWSPVTKTLPDSLRPPRWRDPTWWQDRWALPGGAPILKSAPVLLAETEADWSGVEEVSMGWRNPVLERLADAPILPSQPINEIDLETVDEESLIEMFGGVLNLTRS